MPEKVTSEKIRRTAAITLEPNGYLPPAKAIVRPGCDFVKNRRRSTPDSRAVFLHDGRVETDTNFVENWIRPLKADEEDRAVRRPQRRRRLLSRVATLIETCNLNGVEPYARLRNTLARIAVGSPMPRIHERLPWNSGARAENR